MKKVNSCRWWYKPILWIAHFSFYKNFRKSEFNYIGIINPFVKEIYTTNINNEIPITMFNHEMKHLEQVKKNGVIKFIFKYLFYNIKYGYKNNPFEIEAREYERQQ